MSISTEAHFAQQLASNQPKIREKALKKVGRWLEKISSSADSLDEDIMLRLWKGLFYYFWHCDKMLFQEDRAGVISKYIHVFKSLEYSFMFMDTFFQTMAREWHGIDRYRLEKFMMLIRKMLHESYQLLKSQKWDIQYIQQFTTALEKTVLSPSIDSASFSLKSHMSDIYMEELAKVGAKELTPELVEQFLIPYCEILCTSEDLSFAGSIKKEVFLYLIHQDGDDEFPVLQFDADSVQKLLLKYANRPDLRRKNMKVFHNIVKEFEDYKSGITLADKLFSDRTSKRKLRKRAIEKATLALIEEDEQYAKMKMEYKKKKRNQVENDAV